MTHEVAAGQVAIARVHSRAEVHDLEAVPLPGTTSVEHARSDIAAGALALTAAGLEQLTDAWAPKAR